MRQGFSLVELSIVLVIIGLLTGGIVAGQALIRGAEIRSVTTEFTRYQTAVNSFKETYKQRPGDLTTATSYWGDNASLCADATIPNGNPGTCNGNGNGRLDDASGPNTTGERFQLWNQLALAGMIEGSYTGSVGAVSEATPGVNIPAGKLSQSGWNARNHDGLYGDAAAYYLTYNNFLLFGAEGATAIANNPILTPSEAYAIDTKLDDGLPAYGTVIGRGWNNTCSRITSGAAVNTNYNATYNVSDGAIRCALYFRDAF